MTTIEIIQEKGSPEALSYRAVWRDKQAVGSTPGEALDAIERIVASGNGHTDGTVVIVQHFRPDDFFTSAQRARLQELMDRFHAARALGQELSSDERKELETLVDAEWEGAIDRAAELLRNTKKALG